MQKLITFYNNRLRNLTDRWAFFYLSVITFLIRFPFFFRDYVDRDESTFILLAQSWVDGYLPYIQLWDLKPPLTFAFFAAIISVFGKSIFTIRFFGTLLVVITAFFTFKISLRFTTKEASFWASFCCVLLVSLFGSLQGVMSEHICMAFFTPALYLLITKTKGYYFLLSGVLMGTAVMVKLNMAYPALALGLSLFYGITKRETRQVIWKVFNYGIGILLVFMLTILPYYLNDQLMTWWKSVILAPLEYTDARRYSIFKLAPYFLLVTGFLWLCWKRRWLNFKHKSTFILTVAIAGIMVSFLKGGRINGHYLIQLHPILLVPVVVAFSKLASHVNVKLYSKLALLLFLVPMESYLEYANVANNKLNTGTFYNGEGFTVPHYIEKNGLDTQNILFLGYHIGYWNLGVLPPSKAATHPSNICRDELFPFYDNPRKNSMEELRYLMEELQPKTIVVRKGRRIFDKKEIEENEYMNAYLLKHYKVHATVEKAEILQRL